MTAQAHDVLVGSLSTAQRATIETPAPVTFPRAQVASENGYFRSYRHDCRPLMRAWVVATFSPFGEFMLPFGALNLTTDETIDDALAIAEHVATRELARPLNANERRLMDEVIRDVVCAAIVKRDTEQARQAELSREVL